MDTKQKILERSIQYLLTDGLIFSVDDLARDLKIGKAKIYTYFASKEVLAREIYNYIAVTTKEALDKADTDLSVLLVYQELLRFLSPSLFNRYSLNQAIFEHARSLLNPIKDACFKKLSFPRKEVNGYQDALEASIERFTKKGYDLKDLLQIFRGE